MQTTTSLRAALLLTSATYMLASTSCQNKTPDETPAATQDSPGELDAAKNEPGAEEPEGEDVESVATRPQAATPTAKTHMQEHLDQTDRLREAVQKGELGATRTAAAWLAEHELTPKLAESWKPHVEMMKEAAHSARDAKDLQASAGAVGMLGEACASCHREIAGPKIEDSSPPTGGDLKSQMALHAWAAEQMWLGLMAPSDEAWVRGAEAMAKADLTPEQLFADRSPSPELLEIEETAQKLASEARAIKGADANDKRRGEVYAGLLSTCSECHSSVAKAR